MPMNTIACADVTCCSASAVSSGKPSTTPRATSPSERHCAGVGRGWRNSSNAASASSAAMVARAPVRNSGSNSMTARRVAGSEPLNINMPMKPLRHPPADFSMMCFPCGLKAWMLGTAINTIK
ncbi:hypothetical protein D3C85_1577910 [compost metagenome]